MIGKWRLTSTGYDPDKRAFDPTLEPGFPELPVYIRYTTNKVAKTVETVEGCVFTDFDAEGKLVGVEIIGGAVVLPETEI